MRRRPGGGLPAFRRVHPRRHSGRAGWGSGEGLPAACRRGCPVATRSVSLFNTLFPQVLCGDGAAGTVPWPAASWPRRSPRSSSRATGTTCWKARRRGRW